jgi:hypothetical protein
MYTSSRQKQSRIMKRTFNTVKISTKFCHYKDLHFLLADGNLKQLPKVYRIPSLSKSIDLSTDPPFNVTSGYLNMPRMNSCTYYDANLTKIQLIY